MIKDFASKKAADIYNGLNTRYSRLLPKQLHCKAQRLFDQLNAVTKIETLRVPPSNNLEKLKGDLAEFWSIRINVQWRIIFTWKEGNAYAVDIVDYH
jgi:proteic killer suppression protein